MTAERGDSGTPSYRSRTRLHVAAPLASGAMVSLPQESSHYLRDVLRQKEGARLAIFNARDGEWEASIGTLGRKRAALLVRERIKPPHREPDFWLAFALLKRTRTDLVVEKATELGAARILPVLTARTQGSRVNSDRLRTIAREAAEQCERLSVPEIGAPRALADMLADWPTSRRLIVADEAGGGRPIADALRPSGFQGVTWALLIGPEGGFDGAELDRLRKLPFVTAVALGPRILRAETAAIAALACAQALIGDWETGVRREPAAS
jgi:16S rRNA (uracil1498-N3)-methyltransferase